MLARRTLLFCMRPVKLKPKVTLVKDCRSCRLNEHVSWTDCHVPWHRLSMAGHSDQDHPLRDGSVAHLWPGKCCGSSTGALAGGWQGRCHWLSKPAT